ncbi:MAG TPA: hypothetical protein VF384_03500 [Planctomycetota bacterium]
MHPRRLAITLLVAATAGVCPNACAQERPRGTAPPPDPYTRGEPAAMAKLGYASFGPFVFGSDHDSEDVVELLGDEPVLWIETAHFRIGCALSPLPLRATEPWTDEWVLALRGELKRLDARLPCIDTTTNVLDPWLRAHLTAQRCEDVYAAVMRNLAVDDHGFPAGRPDDATDPVSYRGRGRFLGMRSKFRVLLLRREASHARYTRAFQGREMPDPVRDYDAACGSLYWGGSEETDGGLFRDDLALHAHLAFNVAHNLYSGYRDYCHELPAWLVTGLGHVHSRAVSPRFPTYERAHDRDRERRSDFWQWGTRARGLAQNGVFEPFATFSERVESGKFGLEQHIQSWSFVDWLVRTRKDATMRFVHLLKEPFHARTRLPSPDELRERQQQSLRCAFGVDAAALEAQYLRDVTGRSAARRK